MEKEKNITIAEAMVKKIQSLPWSGLVKIVGVHHYHGYPFLFLSLGDGIPQTENEYQRVFTTLVSFFGVKTYDAPSGYRKSGFSMSRRFFYGTFQLPELGPVTLFPTEEEGKACLSDPYLNVTKEGKTTLIERRFI